MRHLHIKYFAEYLTQTKHLANGMGLVVPLVHNAASKTLGVFQNDK